MRFHCYFQDRGPEYAYLNDETGSNEGRYEIKTLSTKI